jgi:UDP-glucose 4-epimerase
MNVLVTGGAGYIGSHTCVELLERGHKVVVIDNLVNSSAKAIERVEQITGKDVAFYENDVRDRAALDRIFEKHDIDCAIHFAGLKAVGESVAMPLEYYDNNLFSTVRLCEAMRDHGVKNIVFSSSATVYSGDNEMPLKESARTGMCTNPYGWTKYMSEQILRDTSRAVEDFSVSLLRYFNPIGAHSSGLIGEDPRGIPNNLMPFISQVAVGRLDHLNIFGDDYDTPDGTGVRDYIHVVDLARGHVRAVEHLSDGCFIEAVNLGTGRGYSVLELINTFEKVNNIRIPYVVTERRPGDIAECYADPSKAAELLGFRAEYGIEEMCRDSYVARLGMNRRESENEGIS